MIKSFFYTILGGCLLQSGLLLAQDKTATMKKDNHLIDFNSIEFAVNSEKTFAPIRELPGLYEYQIPNGLKVWLATRRTDVEAILMNNNVFQVSPALASQSYDNNPFSKAIPQPAHLLATDGQAHKRLREPLESFFTPEVLETYRNYIIQETDRILNGWKVGEKHDLASEFSYSIPVKVIAKMLGLTWKDELPQYAIALQLVKANPKYLPQVMKFHALITSAIHEKKSHLDEQNMIAVLLKAGLSDDEVLSMSLLSFIAGSGTTASLISQGLRQMINSSNEMTFDRTAAEKLVNETLFRTSPANSAFPRYVHEDITVSGSALKKGDMVIVMLASANFDNKNGEDPLKDYLSFSKGIHHCIGWYVAKMQAEIAFESFNKHFPNAKIDKEEWFSNMVSRDLVKLEVIL